MTEDEIKLLALQLAEHQQHPCRFEGIEPKEMTEVVEFVRGLKGAVCESKSTFRRAIITVAVGSIAVGMGNGFLWIKKYFTE